MNLKVAVIGYGHLGKYHAEKVQQLPGVELHAIVDKNQQQLELARTKYPQLKFSTNLNQVVDEIDAAVVVVPTTGHYETVKTLLKKQKHIFCEKPLCQGIEQAHEIQQIYQKLKKPVVFQVGHSERFHQAWEYLNGTTDILSQMSAFQIQRLGKFKGRASDVDVVRDLMIHDLDLLLHLLGERPLSVYAVGEKSISEHYDFVAATLRFPSGKVATITSQRGNLEEVRQWWGQGAGGCTFKMDLLEQKLTYAEKFMERPNFELLVRRREFQQRDHLLIEQKSFFRSIIEGLKPVVGLDQGVMAVELVELVLESLGKSDLIKCPPTLGSIN